MKKKGKTRGLGKSREATLDALIEEALTDSFGEEEDFGAWHAVLEDRVKFGFQTEVLGVRVKVVGMGSSEDRGLSFECRAKGASQDISVTDLPLPDPPPPGVEWIARLPSMDLPALT